MQAELLRSGELRQVIETMKPGIFGTYTEKDVSKIGIIYLEFESVFFVTSPVGNTILLRFLCM